MTPGRIWRRTVIERNGRLVPLPDDWSLMVEASGLAIARIHAEPGGGWRCVCRSIVEGELKDSIMAWFKTGKEAKDYAEAQTGGQHYVVERKRMKAEILRRAGVTHHLPHIQNPELQLPVQSECRGKKGRKEKS